MWAQRDCPRVLAATAEQQRREWIAHYRRIGNARTAAAPADTPVAFPDRLVERTADLDLGGRTVRLAHLGAGHTDHDLVVHAPDAPWSSAGDLVEHGVPPDFTDARPLDWPSTVDAMLRELVQDTIVPGPAIRSGRRSSPPSGTSLPRSRGSGGPSPVGSVDPAGACLRTCWES